MLLPFCARAQSAEDRTRQSARNLEIALALAAFCADHGQYPERLDDLKPKYLSEVPLDVFTGEAPIYRRQDAGYRLCRAPVRQSGATTSPPTFDSSPLAESLFSTGETSFKMNVSLGEVFTLAFSPSRPDLALGCAKGAVVYDLEAKRTRYAIKPPENHGASFESSENVVWRVLFSPDGKTLATVACSDSKLVLFDAMSLAKLGRSEYVRSLGLDSTASFSSDGKTFCVRDAGWGTLQIFDPSTKKHVATFKHGERFLFREGMFAYSPDSQLIANTYLASGDPKYCVYLDVWSLKTRGRVVHRLLSATGGNTDYTGTRQFPLACSHDGELLAVASAQDGSVTIFQTYSLVERTER